MIISGTAPAVQRLWGAVNRLLSLDSCGNYRGEFVRSLVLLLLVSAGVLGLISEGAKSISALETTVFPRVQPILKIPPTKNSVLSMYSLHLHYHRDFSQP